MELIVLARAEAEVLETQARLEDVLAGLGERFNQRVEETLDQLIAFPRGGSVYAAPFRRILVRDFPFGIFRLGFSIASKAVESWFRRCWICAWTPEPSRENCAVRRGCL
jgi:hypothetical protein